MNIYFDCEFTGLEQDCDLISIALISDCGKRFYFEFNDFCKDNLNEWIKDNVIKHLSFNGHDKYIPKHSIADCTSYAAKGDKRMCREYLNIWLGQFDEDIQFVSDVCHYDFVLLIDLICGHALRLPANISPACLDINQTIADYHKISLREAFNISREEILSNNSVEINGNKHNSLYDAKVIKTIYNILVLKEETLC